MRKVPFANNEYYHVYNRGTEKRKIFLAESDYNRMLLSMRLMNDKKDGLVIAWRDYQKTYSTKNIKSFLRYYLRKEMPLVEIVCFSLLPNHYHLIIKQAHDRGIGEFMRRLGIGYTRYFNERYKRSGVLFQGGVKASHISSTARLQALSAYVNMNCEIHGISSAENYRWSSFPEYLGKTRNGLCAKGMKVILNDFKSKEEYKVFMKDNAKEYKKIKEDENKLEFLSS
jgi:REP element-mobilizing transposase RayT